MELELGLKITRTRDDVTSSSDLRIAKDRTGPVFLSQETDAMFILIAYLKGFRRENVDIEINKDGDRVTIIGKKAVQEMVLMGWVMRKAVELRVFRKVFRIPDGIVLDRIKAKFNDADSTLTIRMPKLLKGMRGVGLEEVKEEEGQIVRPEATQTIPKNKAPEREVEEPTIKKVEETEQVMKKEIDGSISAEITQLATDEVPKKEKDKEAQKEECVEPKVSSKQEKDELAKEESVPQEKPEEARNEIEEETNRAYEMVHGGESKKAGEDLPERVRDTALQEESKFEDQRELVEATPSSEEPSGVKATYSETAGKPEPEQVKPEKERLQQKILEPTPAEVDQHEMHQDTSKAEIVQKEKPEEFRPQNEMTVNNQVALPPQESTTPENEAKAGEMPQQSEKQEPEINEQEPVKAVPQEEKVEDETPEPAYQPKTVVQETNEEEIDEVESTERNVLEHRSAEAEKQKDLSEGSAKKKNSVPKGTRLCPPLIVAGSSILVSIIVLVISWIRAKKR